MRCRSSRLGSAAQARKVATSCAICGTVAGVPSANLTWSGGERRRHLDLMAGEVLVVVHARDHLEPGRRRP